MKRLRWPLRFWLIPLWCVVGLLFVFWPVSHVLPTLELQRFPARGGTPGATEVLLISDLQCPACQRYFVEVINPLLKQEVAQGAIRIRYASLPVVKADSLQVATLLALLGQHLNKDPFAMADWYLALPAHQRQGPALAAVIAQKYPQLQLTEQLIRQTEQQLHTQKEYLQQQGIRTLPALVIHQQLQGPLSLWEIRKLLASQG